MKIYFKIISAFAVLILLGSGDASAQKKHGTVIEEKNTGREPYQLVINFGAPGDDAFLRDWSAAMDERAVFDWGKSSGLVLNEDRGPVSDGKARFVTQYGSTVTIPGLERNRHYWMWIDFVSFRPLRDGRTTRSDEILTSLEIMIDGRVVKSMSFSALSAGSEPLMIEIPYDLSQRGMVEVYFRERARFVGFCGVWDIIVCDMPALPRVIAAVREKTVKKEMRIKEGVIEGRPPVKKRKPGTGAVKGSVKSDVKEEIQKMPAKSGKTPVKKEDTLKRKKPPAAKKPAVKGAVKDKTADDESGMKSGEDSGKAIQDEKKMETPRVFVPPEAPRTPVEPSLPGIKKPPAGEDAGKK